jgi:hypothetical protein
MKKTEIICRILFIFSICFSCAFSPESQLKNQIKNVFESINRHDYDKFVADVDIENISNSFITTYDAGGSGGLIFLFGGPIQTQLQKNIKKFIETCDPLYFENIAISKIKIDGNTAYAFCTIKYQDLSDSCPIEMRFRLKDKVWQLADINFQQIQEYIQDKMDSTSNLFNTSTAKEMAENAIKNEILREKAELSMHPERRELINNEIDNIQTDWHMREMIENYSMHEKCDLFKTVGNMVKSLQYRPQK